MSLFPPDNVASLEGIAARGVMDRLTTLGSVVFVGAVLYWIGLVVYRLYFHPLAKFPGPTLFAISDMPYLFQSFVLGIFSWRVRSLHAKYGEIVRIAPNRLAVDGSVGWADIYANRAGGTEKEFEKIPGFFGPQAHLTMVGALNREDHRRHRRALAHAFSETAMHEQGPVLIYYVDLLIRRLSEATRDNTSTDMLKWFNFVSFDIVGDLALADSFDSLKSGNPHLWITNMIKGLKGASYNRFLIYTSPLLAPLALLDLTGAIKAFRTNTKYGDLKAKARIAQGLELPVETNKVGSDGKPVVSQDFIGYMMRQNAEKQILSEDEIICNAATFVTAGSETTATAMSALSYLFCLPENRKWLDAVTAEVRGVFKCEADVNLRSVGSNVLPILHACIEEALRIHPPSPETPPRISPGALIGGKFVEKGAIVQVFQLATYHSPDHFLEPTRFRPQRFLTSDHPLYEPRFAKDNLTVFKPFSHGPRDCVGKSLAYHEMRLILSRILLRFDYVGLDPSGVSDKWLEVQRAFVVWEKPPLMIKLKERKDL